MEDEYDFGFSSVSKEEMMEPVTKAITTADTKVDAMYKMILPLLNNLSKDADRNEYIHWPNRKEKIEGFIKKLNQVRESE